MGNGVQGYGVYGQWGTGGMGHIGNGSHGQWGTGVWGIWAMRPTGGIGVWSTWAIGAHGVQGVWAMWAMGYRGMSHMGKGGPWEICSQNIKKMSSCQKDVKCQKMKHLDYGGGSQKI